MNTQPSLGWGRGAVSPVTETTDQAVGTVTMGVGTVTMGVGTRYNACGDPLQWVWGHVTMSVGTVTKGVGTRYNGCGDPLKWVICYNGCGDPLQWVWGPVTMGVGTRYNGCGDYDSGGDSAALGKVSLFHHRLGCGSALVGHLFRDKSA